MAQKRACSKSVRSAYNRPVTPMFFISTIARAYLAWTKKNSLRNKKLKSNRASETEEQRKEMLRITRKNKKTENHEKQRLATLQ